MLGAGDVDVITRMAPEQAHEAACTRYFDSGSLRPDEVLLAAPAYGMEALAEVLAERRGGRCPVRVPRSGEGRRAVDMAVRNAELAFQAGEEQRGLNQRILDDHPRSPYSAKARQVTTAAG